MNLSYPKELGFKTKKKKGGKSKNRIQNCQRESEKFRSQAFEEKTLALFHLIVILAKRSFE